VDTIVYIDGFNLYYRALKSKPQFKWLNVLELSKHVLLPSNHITKVWYFTAHVSARLDPGAPVRQQLYLDALKTVKEIETRFGKFLVNKRWAGLVPPDLDPAKPRAKPPFLPWPDVVRIFRTEEKGSDVNLATQLLIDSFKNNYAVAAVITNDTDLVEPIRFATQEMNKIVGIISPVPKAATSLVNVASFVRHIRDQHLSAAQFPDPIVVPGGQISKPATWL
jgi:NYN domain